ncbi:MAG: metal-dependent hydrolase [Elusimicrobiota bacterium]
MDPLSHCLCGALAAKAKSGETYGRFFFWFLVVAGALPDLDIFAGFWGMKAYLFYHRGLTHSFVGIFAQALIAALILFFYYAEEIKSFLYFYLISFSILLIHLFGDWATSYGTPLFLPFSNKNYSLDWISNLSLPVIVIIGSGLWLSRRKNYFYWKLTWLGLIIFISLSAFAHHRAQALLTKNCFDVLVKQKNNSSAVKPDHFFPWLWQGIITNNTAQAYQLYQIDLLKNKVSSTVTFLMPEDTPVVKASLKAERVILFMKHNRWPVAEVKKIDNNWQVFWGNLLFGTDRRLRHGIIVELDKKLQVLKSYRGNPSWGKAGEK